MELVLRFLQAKFVVVLIKSLLESNVEQNQIGIRTRVYHNK